MLKAAIGQFVVANNWEDNAAICEALIARAAAAGADLLVLPEGILARDIADPNLVLRAAQPIDGPFMQRMLAATRGSALTLMFTIHTPDGAGKVFNVFVALRDGALLAQYRKLHLYDAFSARESTNVTPGRELPGIVEVAGLRCGMMTCYDVRFPEVARRLAHDGAEVLVLPAAWVRGPLKEMHWQVLTTARALENTCYLIGAGECGPRNIGASIVIDPLGVPIARAGEAPVLLFAELDPARLAAARRDLPVLANRRFARPELA